MTVTYTEEQISTAVNAGADLVSDELDLGDRDTDLLGIVVNAVMTLLKDPTADLDKVIAENYQFEEEDENPRKWWSGWS